MSLFLPDYYALVQWWCGFWVCVLGTSLFYWISDRNLLVDGQTFKRGGIVKKREDQISRGENLFSFLSIKTYVTFCSCYSYFPRYCSSSNKCRTSGYPHWIKRLPLISTAPLNVALLWIVTIFHLSLNKNAYEISMQMIKQKYCWYLDFFMIFGLLIVKIHYLFKFGKKKLQGFDT